MTNHPRSQRQILLNVNRLTQCTDSAAHGISTKKAPEIREALRSAAKLAENPYSDEVAAFGSDEPLAVGRKIAKAIRRLLK